MKQKDSLTNDIKCLREERQQVRNDRDRLTSQVLSLTAEVEKLKELGGKSCIEMDRLTVKADTLEVKAIHTLLFLLIEVSGTSFIFNRIFFSLQETCSSQKEQIRVLDHQLTAANEKLKVGDIYS